jgi:L-2-hydroxycarboxylate dehydrogenase (NAD+)
VVREGEAFAFVDGGRGPGQLAGVFAGDLAVRKARAAGAAAVGVADSSDMYMVGYFVDRIAERGCVGLLFTASPPLGHAFGGVERALGTNPLAVAVPSAGPHPFLVDLATTRLARSTVRNAAYHREPLPPGSALGPDGRPTTDPEAALGGALSPLAGAKGFGLQLFVAFFSGPLVGAAVGKAAAGWYEEREGPAGSKGHLFLAVDPAAFGDAGRFRETVSAYMDEIRRSPKAPGAAAIRIPGERVHAARGESLRAGAVPIDEVVWANTARLAAELGVAMPA